MGYLLYAQDIEDKSTTEQIWLDYNPTYSLSEKEDLYGDIGARTVFPNEWHRFVVGPSVRYLRPNLIFKKLYYKEELHFGIRFFFTANKSFPNRLEIRPFQGYKLLMPDRLDNKELSPIYLFQIQSFKCYSGSHNWTSGYCLTSHTRTRPGISLTFWNTKTDKTSHPFVWLLLLSTRDQMQYRRRLRTHCNR